MSKLMVSVSGMRGIYGKDLLPENVVKVAAKFGLNQGGGRIVVGRDSRTTGMAMLHSVKAGLLSVGCTVVDIGVVPTPTALLKVEHSDANGGIVITASHNPSQWNAMKFVDSNGLFLYPDKAQKFIASLDEPLEYSAWNKMGSEEVDENAVEEHLEKILNLSFLNVDLIREKRFRVALDAVNGAGGEICLELLSRLGCVVESINTEATGVFAHEPEPLNKNLKQLCELVKATGVDVGFATDPDVDRLAIVDETGECIGEEKSLLLSEDFILSQTSGDIVTNLSSSMGSDDLAAKYGVNIHREKVGEINVGSKMKEIGAVVGGEGNGGVICSELHYTRDAIVGIAIVLNYMASSGKKMSELSAELPTYYFAKKKVETEFEKLDKVMELAENLGKDDNFWEGETKELDTRDGIKICGDKKWVHIRKSGTEPIVRVYVEAETEAKAKKICNEVCTTITKF